MREIFGNYAMGIGKGVLGFGERDAVLVLVRPILGRVPFELHHPPILPPRPDKQPYVYMAGSNARALERVVRLPSGMTTLLPIAAVCPEGHIEGKHKQHGLKNDEGCGASVRGALHVRAGSKHSK